MRWLPVSLFLEPLSVRAAAKIVEPARFVPLPASLRRCLHLDRALFPAVVVNPELPTSEPYFVWGLTLQILADCVRVASNNHRDLLASVQVI